MRGATAKAIQELAGHVSLMTTQRYTHLSPAAKEKAIRMLDEPIPGTAFGDSFGDGRRGGRKALEDQAVNGGSAWELNPPRTTLIARHRF